MFDEEKIVPETPEPVTEPESPEPETPEVTEPQSPYEEELKRIEAERIAAEERHQAELKAKDEERERIIAWKDKALDAEKSKRRIAPEKLKDEILEEVRRERKAEKVKDYVEKLTDDPAEQKVILHHHENSIKQTGDIAEDVAMARAIANRKRLEMVNEIESMNDNANRKSIASMGGGGLPGNSSFKTSPSPVARTASVLLNAFAGKDRDRAKKLTDHLNKRVK